MFVRSTSLKIFGLIFFAHDHDWLTITNETCFIFYGKQFGPAVAKRSPDQKAKPQQTWKETRSEHEITLLPSGLVFRQASNQVRVALNSAPLKDWKCRNSVQKRQCRNSVQKRQCRRCRLQNLACQSLISGSERGKENTDIFFSAETCTWLWASIAHSGGWKTLMSS